MSLRTELYNALNEALESNSPMEAFQKLSVAVTDYLGICGNYLIFADPVPTDPRDSDCNATILHLPHRRADYGDYKSLSPREVTEEGHDEVLCSRPIYFYDHGGVQFSATPFNYRFDSGVAGEQYITKKSLAYLGIVVEQGEEPETYKKLMDEELDEYTRYMSGQDQWIVRVLGDDEVYCVSASTLEELYANLDHGDHRSGSAESINAARFALEQAWANRNDVEGV